MQMDIEWSLLAIAYRPVVRLAARQILEGRLRNPRHPHEGRWSQSEVDDLLEAMWQRVDELRTRAKVEHIPTFGNRHNVFLAAVTTAAYRSFVAEGTAQNDAATLVGDIGWKMYRRLLSLATFPHRWATRDPSQRMERTLRSLLRFPFSAPGRPGYEVDAWSDGSTFRTSWTHCPPQTFVRDLIEADGDRGELEAFYRSWCQYDWPGADVIAGDGERGHYRRLQTLSRGDPVCDMCWSGTPLATTGRDSDGSPNG